MPITTGSFAKALWPGIAKWYGETYAEWPVEHTALFDQETSQKAFEQIVGISGFGLAVEKAQGSGITYDTASQAFITTATHKTYALGFILTEEAIDDNQYNIAALGKRDAKALAFSMRQTMEILAANVYNRAFNSSYTFGDAKELCATDHPLFAGGTFANELSTSADLSEASLEQACIDISNFENDRGLKISVLPQSLIISTDNAFEATRILQSQLQNDSANNAVNALRVMGAVPKGVKVNHYLTDSDAWFLRTNCPAGMLQYNRKPTTFAPVENDFDTGNAKFKASFRVVFTCGDPRGIFGSPGA